MVKAEARLEAEIAAIRANVRALLEEAEAVDAAEDERYGPDCRGDELPAELQRREQRLARIREAKQALEAEAAEREAARRAELEQDGKRPRGPRGGRDAYAPKPSAQRNFTDPDSKIMKTSDGAYHQCYNGQAIVDARAQVIVACELSDEAPQGDRRAGLRPAGHCPRRPAAALTRQGSRPRPVALPLRRPQHPQTPPQRRPGARRERMKAAAGARTS